MRYQVMKWWLTYSLSFQVMCCTVLKFLQFLSFDSFQTIRGPLHRRFQRPRSGGVHGRRGPRAAPRSPEQLARGRGRSRRDIAAKLDIAANLATDDPQFCAAA